MNNYFDHSNSLKSKFCEIYRCDFSFISHILKDFHYKSDQIGGGISQCFAMYYMGGLVGGSVLGLPRHNNKYSGGIDIRRMACIDDSPKNSESWFLGSIIRWIKTNTDYKFVLSYSDKTVNHQGVIYKAANFKQNGETSPTKYVIWDGKTYHPRSLSIDRDYSYKLREAVRKGEATINTGLPKKIWIYEIPKKGRNKKYFVKKIEDMNQLQLL